MALTGSPAGLVTVGGVEKNARYMRLEVSSKMRVVIACERYLVKERERTRRPAPSRHSALPGLAALPHFVTREPYGNASPLVKPAPCSATKSSDKNSEGSALRGADLLGDLRKERERVAHDAEIGDREDRRVLVLVDRDDPLRLLHADHVLRGSADADRDVDLGLDRLAGLPDLQAVRHPAGIDHGS